ncbi:MAG: MarR family transcriptional regulator [Proteobacteria bacterium]|nr:MarR family transcriptional regulator [Pseudomonadota bacterium]
MGKPFYKVETFEGRRSLGYLVRKLHNLVVPRAEALFADAEISFTQWIMLVAVRDGIATTPGEIARHLNHDTGATTRLADQLEKRGLLTRRRCTEDRRVVFLDITAEGKELAELLSPRIVDFWNATLDGTLQPAEAELLVTLMTRLIARLEGEAESPAKTGAKK